MAGSHSEGTNVIGGRCIQNRQVREVETKGLETISH